MFWILVLSALLSFSNAALAIEPQLTGGHAGLACSSCHGDGVVDGRNLSSAVSRARGCTSCHQGYDRIFDQVMTTRDAEKQFCKRSFGKVDADFFSNNCNACHVSDCLDCHGPNGHQLVVGGQDNCLACHKSYFVGHEYLGLAPREDHPRYQRGPESHGDHYLKMRPDIHYENGLECRDCHSMQSFFAGQASAKNCQDCHQPDMRVVEHRISAHMEKLECYACHSAWGAQEYGSFFLRFSKDKQDSAVKDFKAPSLNGPYLQRAYLRRQDAPPLGYNQRGKLSPLRPQFISYYSDLRGDGFPVDENQFMVAEWKAFFPHTVRRGSVMCDSCHNDARRYLLEAPEDRIYRIDLDGLGLSSFWNQQGQTLINGSFVSSEQFSELTKKDAAYTRAYVERWQKLIGHGDASSE